MQVLVRIVRIGDWILDAGLTAIFLLFLLTGLYAVCDNWYIYSRARDTEILTYRPESREEAEDTLGTLSENAVAWLTLDGTEVDYPVMQGESNSSYLNTDPYGNFSLSGSIFLDCRNAPDFSDPYSLIYGHHMEHDAMFGSLDRYLDRDWFDAHQSGQLICPGREYGLTVFAVLKTTAADAAVFSPTDPAGLLDHIRADAVYFREPQSERIAGLSTCAGTTAPDRTVVFCALTERR